MRALLHVDLSPPKALRASLDKLVSAIERGDFRSADIKKLSDGLHYRAKLDREARVILRFGRHGGETVAMLLEVLPNHEYDRSRFLRGAVVQEGELLEATPAEADAQPLRFVHPTRPRFHFLDKPLSFDDEQEAVLRLAPPVVVVGAAGSGKTALLLEKLKTLDGAVGYVTQSAYLAESARTLYGSHGYTRDEQEVEFLSLRELLESIEVPPGRAVRFADFAGFFGRHQQSYRFTAAHQAFEELHGVLGAQPEGPLSEEAYLALGVRQSIYAPEHRRAMHALFAKYVEWLAASRLYDTNLVAHAYASRVEPRFDWLVVDEAQDLTNAELSLVLRTLKAPSNFILTGDANQIVHPNFFSWSGVRALFFREAELARESVSVLPANYRNSLAVTAAANALLRVKTARFGSIDRESNRLVRPAAEDRGKVTLLPASGPLVGQLAQKIRASTGCAVLVLTDDKKEEARRLYGTPLVFAVHEAKGLEYPTVVLHRFVSDERARYEEICRGVTKAELNKPDLDYARARDKDDKSLEVYKFFANALYVALTRGMDSVYMVEDTRPHPLFELLSLSFTGSLEGLAAATSSKEDWQREARKLELQGKLEQAEAIRKTVLREAPVPWEVLDQRGYEVLADKAFAKGSIFKKAKDQLHEWAVFHDVERLALRLRLEAGLMSPFKVPEARDRARARYLAPYRERNPLEVRSLIDRHGVDFRTPMGVTPLMLAAAAGNVALVELLLSRGASRVATDPFGRTPALWALKLAYDDPGYARGAFAAVWDRTAPSSIDVQTSARLFKLGRAQGEYFMLLAAMVTFPGLLKARVQRVRGLRVDELLNTALPATVLATHRATRTYFNRVLARAERDSAYVPARRLFLREVRGQYVFNPELQLRLSDGEQVGEWVPVTRWLNLALYSEHRASQPSRVTVPPDHP